MNPKHPDPRFDGPRTSNGFSDGKENYNASSYFDVQYSICKYIIRKIESVCLLIYKRAKDLLKFHKQLECRATAGDRAANDS
jgi:hypothetical protein